MGDYCTPTWVNEMEDPLSLSPVRKGSLSSLDPLTEHKSEAEVFGNEGLTNGGSEGLLRDDSLKTEVEVEGKRKPYICVFCSEAFPDRYSLKLHAVVHVGEKRHRCIECRKAYKHKLDFTNHMRTHTGERPFACTQCGKTFAVKGILRYHMRTHTWRKH